MNRKLIYSLLGLALLIGFLYLLDHVENDRVEEIVEPEPIVVEDFEGEADPSRMTLDMTTWVWIRAVYNDGREIKPKQADKFTLTFKPDGTFSASTDCNGVGGNYKANKNGQMSFTNMVGTLMYCEGSEEVVFTELLRDTSMYHFTSRGELILDLKFDSGSVIFR